MKITAFLRCSLLAFATAACVAPGHVLQHLPSAVNNHLLPPLEPTVATDALNNIDSASHDDRLRLFQNEIYRNVAEPTSMTSLGSALLQVPEVEVKRTGRMLQVVQLLTMLTPSLVGLPLETYQTTLTARVQIRDLQGKVLGEYEGHGQARVQVAMYYGYSQRHAPGLSDALALRMALAQIRQQLDTAATRLRPLLLAAGPVVTTGGHPESKAAAGQH
ncbi:hypothetical protein [Hymenobacter siberiensis]|jgi:hypothetical protein|uniref:hypothetical protein n=1 Tax=Hymenobacter siberiensis TaxID=2848396 RepID=UPI001C1E3F85|nr:hypothetical protein [Hymenobacter siberiensis]MBU6121943.1 hypothetical protein [Hymenobacter siberiensis]